jgi:protein involved in polysaccharide export with SLBB domain
VAGLKYGQLQPYLKSQIEKFFRNFELSVTMGQLRSIQIFVVGRARRPGSYTVGSLSTLVNAVFASGGPSVQGSLRNIQLRRGNQLVTEFDLYDLLLKGDKSKDAQLLPGDVIYIPAIGPQVAVIGSVNAPGVYEVKSGSELKDVLDLAGGLSAVAAGQTAFLEHVENRTVRTVLGVDLGEKGLQHPISDGDLITIRSLSAKYENTVTLRGNLAAPGRYPWKPGLKVHDLIPNKDFLVTRSFWLERSDLGIEEPEERFYRDRYGREVRKGPPDADGAPDNDELCRRAEQMQATSDTEQQKARANLMREVCQSPVKPDPDAPQKGTQRLTNQIRKSAPEINWDYAVIQRFSREDLATTLLPFNLGKAIADPGSVENVTLQSGDIINIFSQIDLKVPEAKKRKFVRLEGEFVAGGVYPVLPGETLRSLIERVGGLTSNAYLYGAEFTRESAREQQQLRLDAFIVQLEQDVERESSVKSLNVVSPEEAAGLASQVESQRRLVAKLRQLRATGRVVLQTKPTDSALENIPELVLEDGDRIFVPYTPATVNVIGAVYNDSSYLYESSRHPSYYLRKAGGGTRTADRGHVFVLRADGSVVTKNRGAGWFGGEFDDLSVMPGDTIVVPENLGRVGILRGLKDWSQVLSQFALGAAALQTLTR